MNWDKAARWYRAQLFVERPAFRMAIALAAPKPTDRLLDVGTGTGGFLRELSRLPRARQPEHVMGVDVSSAMMARAPSLPPGWTLEVADAAHLPFPDGSFDVITTTFVLHILHHLNRRP